MATALLFYLAIFMASGAITAAAPDELRVILFENVGWPFVREIEGSAGDYEGKLCMEFIDQNKILNLSSLICTH